MQKNVMLTPLVVAALLLAACQTITPPARAQETGALSVQERVQRGKALFDEKCRTVAGEKIYRTVPDVEGVLLLKVRPKAGDREWADKMWPGAAFAVEPTGDGFLNTFLGAEVPLGHPPGSPYFGKPISEEMRGSITPKAPKDLRPIDRPGYRYVMSSKKRTASGIGIPGPRKWWGRRMSPLWASVWRWRRTLTTI